MEPIIELKNTDIYQRDQLVLKNINLLINKGEFLYLIGKVGSGKTSLLKTLYHELPMRIGKGSICGYQLHKMHANEVPLLRRKLGIVFQDFQLLRDRSVFQNLQFVLKATGWHDDKLIQKRIEKVLNQVQMENAGSRMPHQLSGGEQQRIVIARALLNDPEIILADEPTGNLDPETSESILNLFKDIHNQGKTVVVATHDYPLIKKFPARTMICEGESINEYNSDLSLVDFETLLEPTPTKKTKKGI